MLRMPYNRLKTCSFFGKVHEWSETEMHCQSHGIILKEFLTMTYSVLHIRHC